MNLNIFESNNIYNVICTKHAKEGYSNYLDKPITLHLIKLKIIRSG